MRKVFGHGLGVCSSKEKLYEAYIATELSMGEIERCRKLYEGYLEHYPTSSKAWIAFCGLEAQLHEDARVHQLYEMALTQSLDAPEVLWKNYIDYEIGRGDEEAARQLYVRLLAATKNIKAWLSFAAFEHDIAVSKCQQQQQQGGQTDGKSDFARMHKVFTDGNEFLRKSESKEERAALLAQWLEYERKIGDTETIKKVEAMQPRRVKKRKMLAAEDGVFLFLFLFSFSFFIHIVIFDFWHSFHTKIFILIVQAFIFHVVHSSSHWHIFIFNPRLRATSAGKNIGTTFILERRGHHRRSNYSRRQDCGRNGREKQQTTWKIRIDAPVSWCSNVLDL